MATASSDTLIPWGGYKKFLWMAGLLVPILGFAQVWFYELSGYAGWAAWTASVVIYFIIPIAEWIFGVDNDNPPESAVDQLESEWYYRIVLYAYVPLQMGCTVLYAWYVATHDMPLSHYLGFVMGIGWVNGIGINTAHELGHKKVAFERWLSRVTLAPSIYGHFYIEHNRGHHKNVATPGDPASAKLGESFWVFLPRTVKYSAVSAWNIEKERLNRAGKSAWSWQNETLTAWLMTVVLFAGLTIWLGWSSLLFLVLQGIYAFSRLEVVNYIEHYGLLRQKQADGRYERCQPKHSWNSNCMASNLLLYHLQRHSDHHAHPTRRYQALRHFEESPQLPSGYASMLIPAYISPFWYWMMDKRVLAHYNGDVTKANIYPPKRARILARYGVSEATPSTPEAA